MATTTSKMIAATRGLLQSWSLDEEQSTTLAADMGVGDLSFTITTARGIATGVSPGIIEIDEELMYCDSISSTGGTITAWGRGHLETVPAAHVTGTRIISQPTFPRAKILDEMNQTMARIFPDVFAVKVFDDTVKSVSITYNLPDDAQWVLAGKWQRADGRQYWQSLQRMRVSPIGSDGVTVDVADHMMPGRPIQFIYAAKPSPLVNESDDFETTTGLSISVQDVVTIGAADSLTVSQELSRLQMSSVEQQNRAQLVAPSAALTSSRYLEQRFQQRLMEERKSLQRLYPPRVNRSWY
jgi:hypothetical protein